MKKLFTLFIAACWLSSCDSTFQYSPNEVRVEESLRDLNRKNLERLRNMPMKDSFNFILIGDSQRS